MKPSISGTLRRLLLGAAALLSALMVAQPARAADAIAPRDGETVSSLPTFAFDFVYGTADIELSRAPDVRTDGPEAGSFVDYAAGNYALLYQRNPPDGLAPWPTSGRLKSGLYYWHVKVRDDGSRDGYGETQPYGVVRTLTVRDEPAVLEGWTLRADRLHATERCRRVRLRGKVAWSDNDDTPKARLTLNVRAGGRTLRWRQPLDYSGGFDTIICTRATRLAVTPKVVDRIGQVTAAASRTVDVK